MNSKDDGRPGMPGPNLADEERRIYRRRQAAALRAKAAREMQKRVKLPGGVRRTVAETLADEERLHERIIEETSHRSRKHLLLPLWLRLVPEIMLYVDLVLLMDLFARIFDVHWGRPSSNLVIAGTLAGAVTVLAYSSLAFTGGRIRTYKNHEGTIHFDELDGLTKLCLGGAGVLTILLGVLMYLHIASEVPDSHRAGATALLVSLTVAGVSAIGNMLVVLIHALDGSDETARRRELAAATRRPVRRADRLLRRAAEIDPDT